jgi:hypothetical protein
MSKLPALPPTLVPRLIGREKVDAIAKHRADQRAAAFDHLCANGKLFTGIKRPKGFRQMRRKDCFRNSQSLAIRRRARYVEGLCVGCSGHSFAHGWLTLDGEHAIDVTLPDAESYVYFGVALDTVALAKAICESGYYQSYLGLDSTMSVPPQLAEAIA